ncbi:MAG: hypothetical protein EOP55_21180, partial [Sphingobacteriales bacterium]
LSGKVYGIKQWKQEGNRIRITVPLGIHSSLFVVFKPKEVQFQTSDYYGNKLQDVRNLPLNQQWKVNFQKKMGAPEKADLSAGSYADSEIFGIKYFSGTATYQTTKSLSYKEISNEVILDLGEVKNIAEIIINDKIVDTLWCPPFKAKISKFLKPGENKIAIKVTNTWWNRMVGDEQLPEDLTWYPNLNYAGKDFRGYEIKEIPKWVWTGEQRPSKDRVSFSPWKFVEKNSKLEEAGLIGPVNLTFGKID